MSIQLSFLFDALVKPVFVSSHYAIFPCLIYFAYDEKAWSLGWRFSKAKKMCFLYQTYKLKLSNLERKLFIGMVCKKMGEEVNLKTLSFFCKHFLCHFSTVYKICRTSGKCLTNLVRLRRSPFWGMTKESAEVNIVHGQCHTWVSNWAWLDIKEQVTNFTEIHLSGCAFVTFTSRQVKPIFI